MILTRRAAKCGEPSHGIFPDGRGARYPSRHLVFFDPANLSSLALTAIEDSIATERGVLLSAISLVEVLYLAEKGRLPEDVINKLEDALEASSSFAVIPVDAAVAKALGKISRDVVPDMPDRIIAATAAHLGAPLVTRDRRIRAAGIKTVW